ncbi:receptor-type tyrosine-protein phosphatase H [Monodelphis domestica]|uniref:receptor-type tyrosine-protein phosphatase H n=1 Tax=Monodelphis domestica TaxID=13616 RepID=UPI0024E25591|nr:receptor-type tyrosine-protein phosphatase H [Monodelphis domestica]
MVNRSTSSVSLRWTVPSGPQASNYTYWVSWAGEGILNQSSTEQTEYEVRGLDAATMYNFTVQAGRNDVNSSGQSIQVATVPNEVGELQMVNRSTSSVSLRWGVPSGPQASDYIYWVSWAGEGILNQSSTEQTEYEVRGLDAATMYNFTVQAERNDVNSSGQSIQEATGKMGVGPCRRGPRAPRPQLWPHHDTLSEQSWPSLPLFPYTVPNEVGELQMVNRSTSLVSLRWTVPSGPQASNYTYWVSWAGEGILNQSSTGQTEYEVRGLDAATMYNFTVQAEKNDVNSFGQSIQVATGKMEGGVQLTWSGNISETQYTVKGLEPGTAYEFTIKVEGSIFEMRLNASTGEIWSYLGVASTAWRARDGFGFPHPPVSSSRAGTVICLFLDHQNLARCPAHSSSTHEALLAFQLKASLLAHQARPRAPSLPVLWVLGGRPRNSSPLTLVPHHLSVPNEVGELQMVNRSTSLVSLRWTVPSGPQASNYTYWVSWAGEGILNQSSTEQTEYEVRGLDAATMYNFTVQAERNDVNSSGQSIQEATAPDPATIVSCTSTDAGYGLLLSLACPVGNLEAVKFEVGQQRGEWRDPCNSSLAVRELQPARAYRAVVTSLWADMEAASEPVTCYTERGGVIAGAVIGVLLLLGLLAASLIFFLRRTNRKWSRRPSALPASSQGDIPAQCLADHIQENQKDSNYGFAEEYQQLALEGLEQLQTAASALENKSKNRFSNVLPYDWARVPLQPIPGDPGSDYINASFLPGLCDPREFIATQGPLPQTVGDFWRLVWEQQSRTIVMLTNCVESGRVKCEHYWPLDAQPCNHGRLRVTLRGETVAEHWTVRDLHLFHMDLKQTLCVRQFHYTVWPDHGVPHSPDPLLAFQALLRQWLEQSPEGGPPIVHCSAGVGRTGTFIALDVLLRQLQKHGHVGVQSFVRRMRRSRPLMVQTEVQYIFLYQTLLRHMQQSEDQEGSFYENVDATKAYEQELCAT